MQQSPPEDRVLYPGAVPGLAAGSARETRRKPPGWVLGGLALLLLVFAAVAGRAERGRHPEATPEAALQTMGAYFAAFEQGDLAALADLIAPAYGVQLLQMEAWRIAQNTDRTVHECVAADPDPGGAISVTCILDDLSQLRRAVGAPPIESWGRYRVAADGYIYPGRISLTVATAEPGFNRWLAREYPEIEASVTCCSWPSVAAAVEDGRIIAAYADRYAAYLSSIGCRYDEACDLIPTFAAEREALDFLGELAADDLDAARSRLVPGLAAPGGDVSLPSLAQAIAGPDLATDCQAQGRVIAPAVQVTCLAGGNGQDAGVVRWTMTVTPDGISAVSVDT